MKNQKISSVDEINDALRSVIGRCGDVDIAISGSRTAFLASLLVASLYRLPDGEQKEDLLSKLSKAYIEEIDHCGDRCMEHFARLYGEVKQSDSKQDDKASSVLADAVKRASNN